VADEFHDIAGSNRSTPRSTRQEALMPPSSSTTGLAPSDLRRARGRVIRGPAPFSGGAMARILFDATAFAHRSSRIMGDAGAYVNFLVDEGEARVHQAYTGSTWDRLAEIKRRYDPTNLFHRNQNIAPADGARA
jgi:hypothetical protein